MARWSRCCSPGDGIRSIHPSLELPVSKFTLPTANQFTVVLFASLYHDIQGLQPFWQILQGSVHSFRSNRSNFWY
jgi:hypothetical protein